MERKYLVRKYAVNDFAENRIDKFTIYLIKLLKYSPIISLIALLLIYILGK